MRVFNANIYNLIYLATFVLVIIYIFALLFIKIF